MIIHIYIIYTFKLINRIRKQVVILILIRIPFLSFRDIMLKSLCDFAHQEHYCNAFTQEYRLVSIIYDVVKAKK